MRNKSFNLRVQRSLDECEDHPRHDARPESLQPRTCTPVCVLIRHALLVPPLPDLNSDQKVHIHFDSHTKDGVVGYTRRMADGDIKIHATMNMGDGMGKQMPRIHVQKEWSVDVGN